MQRGLFRYDVTACETKVCFFCYIFVRACKWGSLQHKPVDIQLNYRFNDSFFFLLMKRFIFYLGDSRSVWFHCSAE